MKANPTLRRDAQVRLVPQSRITLPSEKTLAAELERPRKMLETHGGGPPASGRRKE
jgi:hypothetical protein